MKKIILLLIFIIFSSCFFGSNENSQKIIRDFYIISWDESFWQISRSKKSNEFEPNNIIIKHDVFGVGHNKNFIIAIQHPCENNQPHLNDYLDDFKVNKNITNYFIIELLKDEEYKINKFRSKIEYLKARIKLGVPKELKYKFYKENI